MKLIKDLFNKYKSIIMYLFFGVCTTLVNIISYYVFAHIFKTGVMFSTVISWILAVLFAYLTNRKWVFESHAKTKKEIFEEIVSFFSCRLATGIVDWLCMYVFVERFGFNDVIIKILSNILVIVLNYVASKLIIFKQKDEKDKSTDKSKYFIYGGFFIVTFVILMLSPLHIWVGKDATTDSSVFKTIAMMMNNGFMPYLQSFDHKGPLLYIINFLGLKLSPYRGVWIFEFISVFMTMHYMYKIGRLKCNKLISFFLSVVSISMLFIYFEGGNFTEEYAMPFIAGSLYIFLDYIFNGVINKKRLILCGLSFGAVLMLRPNMVGTWIVFCLYILFQCIKNKEYKELKMFILYFLIGTVVIITPFLIWLGANGALKAFYDAYIVFNKEYSTSSNMLGRLNDIWQTVIVFINNLIIVLSFIITAFLIKKNKKYIIYLIYMIVSMLLIAMSGRVYYHYMIIFIPVLVLPFADFLSECVTLDKKNKNSVMTIICVSFFIITLLPNWVGLLKDIPEIIYHRNDDNISSDVRTISNIINSKTTKKEKISVYGNYDVIYIISNREHATKYSYTFPLVKVSDKIKNEYFESLSKEKPRLIVVHYNDNYIKNFLDEYNYSLIWDNGDSSDFGLKIYELQE